MGEGRLKETFVAWMDGCLYGWVVVLLDCQTRSSSLLLVPSFPEALQITANAAIVAVDIPIELMEEARPGGRDCDILARRLLGDSRASSIFSPPVRKAFQGTSYEEALRINRSSSSHGIGLSRQCFGIFRKFSEVDQVITQKLQTRVIEVHPEVCFYEMNNGRPLQHGKKSKAGLEERKSLLINARVALDDGWLKKYQKSQVASDDILDACAACWTAERCLQGQAICIPVVPPTDSKGLRMEMWR